MGTVYRAQDIKLHRAVAIKFLSNDLAGAAALRRFQREARLASSLNHPHILTVHDTGEFEGRQYIVMELADGGTLRDWMRAGTQTWMESVELLIGVADAVAAAHEAGILHRDIKPENILLMKSGYAKLADFGVAKVDESPEQATGRAVDASSDVFSFAIVLYEMLVRRRPFEGRTELDLLHAIANQPPQPLPGSIPEPLRAIVDQGLRKDPGERATMREIVRELRRLVRHSGVADPSAWGALFMHPIGGGKAQRLCDLCAPPWGTDTIPFYFGWSADGRSVYWNFTNTMFAIPLPPGQMLPAIRGEGIQSPDGVAALPGARVVSRQERTFPGPDPAVYVFMKVSTQRNIYRVPVRLVTTDAPGRRRSS